MALRKSAHTSPVQGFAPDEIRTNVTALDLTGVLAIRLSEGAEYYLNGVSADVAVMPAGVTVISTGITALTFTSGQTVEVMFGA